MVDTSDDFPVFVCDVTVDGDAYTGDSSNVFSMLVCDVTRVVVGAVDANRCNACCRVVVSRVLRIVLSYSAVVVAEIIQCNNRYWSIAVLTLARQDVDGRIKVAWSRWRDLSGVIYDKKVPMKLKSKLYKTVVRHAMVYGSEFWALRKQEEQRLHTTEIKMLRWSQGKTRKHIIKNETIRGIARVTPIKSGLTPKTTIVVWACDAKGRDLHNKKHVEHDGDGNPTQRTSKYEMAGQTET